MKADNDNIDPHAPLRLKDAVAIAFPYGGMSVSGLRREAFRGRLVMMRIAGKDFTTLAYIEEMKSRCLVLESLPASGCGQPVKTEKRSGSSSTVESNSALAAANMIVERLSKSSRSTSPSASLRSH
ncbi:excisionase [Aquamicrobium zhengzhouense]|uniref:Excisionase n=1 Tax=Aquamicrobium zhengzhouense TaxID=2781738 RepID=A0ABS0SE85_9HYPH|nr:excisionase [Aquamicrobium zhengzhouense]MBI1620792.1 hypothetical protein [Aquamicrobium zhengzhouense]